MQLESIIRIQEHQLYKYCNNTVDSMTEYYFAASTLFYVLTLCLFVTLDIGKIAYIDTAHTLKNNEG